MVETVLNYWKRKCYSENFFTLNSTKHGKNHTILYMCLITPLCILIKSYKSFENKGFIVMCSLYPFIWFHTMFPLPWLLIMAKARAGKSHNAIQQSVAIVILWTKKSSLHKKSIRLKELISAALLTFRWASIIIKSTDLKRVI